MSVQVFQLFWKKGDGPYDLVPGDERLYSLAMQYANEFIVNPNPIEFRDYRVTWVACEIDDDNNPVKALGVLCMMQRTDFPICRFTDNAAIVKLVQRANDHLHDLGLRGTHVMVHLASDELPEHHCPDRDQWMERFHLIPADRWAFKIR
jgi:hypothetical protein